MTALVLSDQDKGEECLKNINPILYCTEGVGHFSLSYVRALSPGD